MARGYRLALLWAMMKEEWRLHRSFVGSVGSGFFPVAILLFSLAISAGSPALLESVSPGRILLALHIGALLYGLGVGALAEVGEQAMTRRLGQVGLLLRLPLLHPLPFRAVIGVFFVKDAIYYTLYSLFPLLAGMSVLVPMGRASAGGLALLALTTFLTFITGMALSFLLSALAARSRAALAGAAAAVLGLVATVWPLGLLEPGQLLLPLGIWEGWGLWPLALSAPLAAALSLAALAVTRERFPSPARRVSPALMALEDRLSFCGRWRLLMAKEWLELRRSGALGPVVAGFVGPLVGVYALIWVVSAGVALPISFNIVFYGGVLGLLGLMTYSWMTNIEPNEFLNAQPVSVDEVIGAKLRLFFLLTAPVSLSYLGAIGLINGELGLLPLAAVISLSTMTYITAVAARLTGLRANTMLFDARVLARFTAAAVPPLVLVTLASFSMSSRPLEASAGLALLSGGLFACSAALLRAVPGRWRRESFGM
ncbi:MAG: hypothetical protein ACUVV6_02315 [Thermoplasmatota archaeon]